MKGEELYDLVDAFERAEDSLKPDAAKAFLTAVASVDDHRLYGWMVYVMADSESR